MGLRVLLELHPHPYLTTTYFLCHRSSLHLPAYCSLIENCFTGIVLHMASNEGLNVDRDSITAHLVKT